MLVPPYSLLSTFATQGILPFPFCLTLVCNLPLNQLIYFFVWNNFWSNPFLFILTATRITSILFLHNHKLLPFNHVEQLFIWHARTAIQLNTWAHISFVSPHCVINIYQMKHLISDTWWKIATSGWFTSATNPKVLDGEESSVNAMVLKYSMVLIIGGWRCLVKMWVLELYPKKYWYGGSGMKIKIFIFNKHSSDLVIFM